MYPISIQDYERLYRQATAQSEDIANRTEFEGKFGGFMGASRSGYRGGSSYGGYGRGHRRTFWTPLREEVYRAVQSSGDFDDIVRRWIKKRRNYGIPAAQAEREVRKRVGQYIEECESGYVRDESEEI